MAEKLVISSSAGAALLRLPTLYGPIEFLTECMVTSLYTELKKGITEVDDWTRFYPTWVGDVAAVLQRMVDFHIAGVDVHGIYHYQSNEQFTQYEMTGVIAQCVGRESNLKPSIKIGSATRPSTQLNSSRLEALFGGNMPEVTPFRQGLFNCLAQFCETCEAAKAHNVVELQPSLANVHFDTNSEAIVDPCG